MSKQGTNLGNWLGMICVTVLALAASTAHAAEPLVSAKWLAANMDKVVVLDVQAKDKDFLSKGHIPSAVLVPWKQVRGKAKEGGVDLIKMLPSKASFTRLMKVSGVNNDSHVVITTSGSNSSDVFLGTRLYWQLKYYGHDEVSMLDGGNAAWALSKQALSKSAEAKPQPGNFTARAERKELLTTTADIQSLVNQKSRNLIDARTLDYHLGLEQKKKYVFDAGHIPGSKIVPHDVLLTHGKAAKFRSAEQLKGTLTAMGVDLKSDNVTYCNSGHLGSGLWFVLHELSGNKSAKLYDGSMHAWTKGNTRPVTTFALN
ncbi:rhodanese-like domain-containing protein [Magnetovibrio sp. PR-2]|uniref:sulfurtransferase n=1 Tax=Magnetovibrio sp. PR-2 TaxID=3120356 RepID=UPI002FCE55AB